MNCWLRLTKPKNIALNYKDSFRSNCLCCNWRSNYFTATICRQFCWFTKLETNRLSENELLLTLTVMTNQYHQLLVMIILIIKGSWDNIPIIVMKNKSWFIPCITLSIKTFIQRPLFSGGLLNNFSALLLQPINQRFVGHSVTVC